MTSYKARMITAMALGFIAASAHAADAPPAQSLQVLVASGVLAKVVAPAGWKFIVEASSSGGPPVIEVVAPGNFLGADLDFSIDSHGKLATQEAIDALVRTENAEAAKGTPVKTGDVVEMKSKTGLGAYVESTIPLAPMAKHPEYLVYMKFCSARFVTGNVVVKCFMPHDDKQPFFQQALKMVEEGITVETVK